MRTETIVRDIYTFAELDESARERAIEHWAQRLAEDWDPREATESVNDWLAEVLGTRDLKVVDWDTGSAQHVRFAGSLYVAEVRTHLTQQHAEHPDWPDLAALAAALPTALPDEGCTINCVDGRYAPGWDLHELFWTNEHLPEPALAEKGLRWREWLDLLRGHVLTALTAEVDSVTDPESVADFIEANDIEFLKDGSPA